MRTTQRSCRFLFLELLMINWQLEATEFWQLMQCNVSNDLEHVRAYEGRTSIDKICHVLIIYWPKEK